jgi:hypothetical protein
MTAGPVTVTDQSHELELRSGPGQFCCAADQDEGGRLRRFVMRFISVKVSSRAERSSMRSNM